MEDENGIDEMIMAVPINKLHPSYADIHTYTDLPKILIEQITHFFEHYQDLEPGKWVRVSRWVEADEVSEPILSAIKRFHNPSKLNVVP